MRSQVEGNTRRIWIRNEITSKNAHDCIYSVAIMQSSDSHCIFVFVFLLGMQHNLTLVSYQNPRSLQNLRLVQRVPRQIETRPSFRMIAVFESDAIQTTHKTSGTNARPSSMNGGAKKDVRELQLAALLALRRSLASLAPLPVHPKRNPALWTIPQLR